MRIILFDETIQVVDFIMDRFAEAFVADGHEVFTVHLKHINESLSALDEFIRGGVDFAFCINNSAFVFDRLLKMKFWDAVGVPLFDYLLDHPASYIDLLNEAPAACIPLCVDAYHPDYICNQCPNIAGAAFLPLAGTLFSDEKNIPWDERSIDVMFCGYSRKVGVPLTGFAATLRDYLMKHNNLPYEIALVNCVEENGLLNEINISEAIVQYMSVAVDVMGYYRQQAVRTLVNAGIDVTVYGGRWEQEKDLMANPHFIYKGEVTQEECIRDIYNTKIVLNCMPWFKAGSHDRIPNAMLAGAISVTDSSEYIEQQFVDGEDLYIYDLNHMEELPEIVSNILNNPQDAQRVISNGYTKAIDGHLWKHRAREVVEAVESMK